MKLTSVIFIVVANLSHAASLVFDPQDSAFFNTSTQNTGGGSSFTVQNTSGLNTSSYTINYLFSTDLSSCGGPASASFSFALTFSSSDGNIVNIGSLGIDGASDTTNAIESGEAITISVSQSASPYFTLEGIRTNQMYGDGDARSSEATNPISGANPNFFFPSAVTSHTVTNVDAGTDTFGVGFITFRVIAVPEPSSSALLGLAGLGILVRRRR